MVVVSQAMTGSGDYDHHSDYQLRDARSQTSLVGAAADQIVTRPDLPVVLADYGCAQGRVSNALVKVAVRGIRQRNPDVPICVYHNDVLANDWQTLFERLRSAGSYLSEPGGPITPLVSATSFYEPVTPLGLVDLGLSFAALQWLAAPGPPGAGPALYFDQLDPAARSAMAERAEADWTRFLRLRADELVPGGRMVLDMMGVDDGGVAAGHDAWRHVRAVAEELVAEGRLDGARLDAYVFPVYERAVDDVARPFRNGLVPGLRLEHISIAESPNPMIDRYRAGGDATALARDFVGFFRAFSEPSVREGLGLDAVTSDELYRRLRDRVEGDAGDFDFLVHVITVVVAHA